MRDEWFHRLNQIENVSRETFLRLILYHDLLVKWQSKINLVSSATITDAFTRHIIDSAQLVPIMRKLKNVSRETFLVADIGTGAGFPGMVLAIMGVGEVHLIDSDTKKITFLKEVSRLTHTPVIFHNTRIENSELQKIDCFTSRATSTLNDLLRLTSKNVSRETFFLFHKGKNYSSELEEAKKNWLFDHQLFPSITDPNGVIIHLSHIARKPHEHTEPAGKKT
ncbi:MAG: 16S rRNA (guanine(527)-N(7))-methyltransferase RsmG [Rickettsiales bacterium]|nr:16S rRNA (guanine(527)-N(7))-methyltransferase RsmG [Rickettsiales bacterium]